MPIIIGVLTLVAFVFWEVYANLAEPVIPTRLFRNVRGFTVVLVAEFVSGMLLYALIALYPVQIATIYESRASIAAWEDGASLLGALCTLSYWAHAGADRPCQVGCAVMRAVFIGTMAAMSERLQVVLLQIMLTSLGRTFKSGGSHHTRHSYWNRHRVHSTYWGCDDYAQLP